MTCVSNSYSEGHLKSLNRVQSYPIVNDSLVLVFNSYQWLKSRNSLIDNTLSLAENTLKTIKDTAEPIVVRRLGFVDDVVNNQLERLEKKCPLILESSSAIGKIPSQVYHDKLQQTVEIVIWPVTTTFSVVSKTSHMALSAVEESLKIFFPSTIVSYYIIDKSEELLDKYLPDIDDCSCEPNKPGLFNKVKRLSKKTQRKLYKRALAKIDLLQKLSMAKLEKIKEVLEDLQGRKEKLRTTLIGEYSHVMESIRNILYDLFKHSDFLKDVLNYAKSIKTMFSSLVNSSMEYLLNTTMHGIEYLNKNLLKLQNLLNESTLDVINSSVIEVINNVITEIRKGMTLLTKNIKKYLCYLFHEEDSSDSTDVIRFSETDDKDFQNPDSCEAESRDSDN